MAQTGEKKTNKWLYIVLVIAVGVFIFDSLTSEKSLVKLKKPNISNLIKPAKDERFNKQKLFAELNELNQYRNYFQTAAFPKNPFYKPIQKRKIRTIKAKPGLVAVVKQIIEGDPPYAEIDDQILTVGDTYKGWRIVSIKGNKVVFEKDGRKTTLSTNPGMQMR